MSKQRKMKFCLSILMIYCTLCTSLSYDAKGFDDSVLYKIDWPGALDLPLDEDKFEPITITTHDQEKYRCFIPQILNKEENQKSVDSGLSPLHFISPIFSSSSCSYRIEAYWAYEICHGHHVKQYHEERDGKSIKVQEYYLGKWDDVKLEKLSKKLQEDQDAGRKFKTTKIDNIKYPYLEMEMSDGTICDLNNEPRVTRVRYICYPHGKNEIYSLKETSTCNYEAIILTSALCMHPAFVPEDNAESMLNCVPLGDAPQKPLSWLKNEIENLKIRHKQQSDIFRPKENIAIIKIDPKDGTVRMDFINAELGEQLANLELSDPSDEAAPETTTSKLSVNIRDTTPVTEFLEGKNCLKGGSGWWKYEFCYGKHVRQFHIDQNGETSLMLGFFDKDLHSEWLKKNPEKRPKPKSIRTEISHFYQGGTVCDKTNEKRQTEVKLKCLLNVSSPATVSMYLLEPKTCQYILVVESPLICEILQVADDDGLVPKNWAILTQQTARSTGGTSSDNEDSGTNVDEVEIR